MTLILNSSRKSRVKQCDIFKSKQFYMKLKQIFLEDTVINYFSSPKTFIDVLIKFLQVNYILFITKRT